MAFQGEGESSFLGLPKRQPFSGSPSWEDPLKPALAWFHNRQAPGSEDPALAPQWAIASPPTFVVSSQKGRGASFFKVEGSKCQQTNSQNKESLLCHSRSLCHPPGPVLSLVCSPRDLLPILPGTTLFPPPALRALLSPLAQSAMLATEMRTKLSYLPVDNTRPVQWNVMSQRTN